MVFAVLSICTAGGLEMMRLHYYWKDNKEHIHYQCIGMSRYGDHKCNRIERRTLVATETLTIGHSSATLMVLKYTVFEIYSQRR